MKSTDTTEGAHEAALYRQKVSF